MWSPAEPSSGQTDPLGEAPGSASGKKIAKRSTDTRPIGREAELAALTGLLFDPSVRILTLTGPAGVGKSRLARAVAQPALFGADIVRVDLSTRQDAAAAWRAVAAGLDPLAPRDDAPLPDRLADRIGDRELLLVLDNCDLVAADVSLDIARLSARCPGLRVLVTSRVSLDIYNERLFPVRPLPVPVADSSSPFDQESPAVRLFVQRARAQRPDYTLLEEDVPVVTGICAELDGIPLAIELSAGAVGMLGPRTLLARLRDGEWPASSRLLDLPARHRTVEDSLSWADPALCQDSRRVLQQLAVCEGRFDLATAQHLTGLSWPGMMPHLETLVHMSLLQRTERSGGDVAFRMLNMVRNYYLHREPPEPALLAQARDRHAEYFGGLAATAGERLRGPEQVRCLTAVHRRLDDYRAAIRHAQAKGDHSAAVAILVALDVALDDLGCLPEMTERLLVSVGRLAEDLRAGEGDRLLSARALETAASWSAATGDHEAAGELLARAAEEYHRLADRAGAARVAGALAGVGHRTGAPAGAAERAARAVRELDRLDDPRGAAAARRTLASVEAQRDPDGAEAHLLRALEDLRPTGDSRSRAITLTELARVRASADRPAEAYEAVREAMGLLCETGGPRQVAGALETAARVLPHVSDGQQHRAARLLLAAGSIRARHLLPAPQDAPALAKLLERLRLALGESTLTLLRRQMDSTSPLAALNDALSAPPAALRASTPDRGDDVLHVLTPRQAQIAKLVANGLTNRQIARNLGLSEWTVINHLRQVMQRLQCPSRVHVARLVQQAAV